MAEHAHHCPRCDTYWAHAPDKPCLAPTAYRCPPCTGDRDGDGPRWYFAPSEVR